MHDNQPRSQHQRHTTTRIRRAASTRHVCFLCGSHRVYMAADNDCLFSGAMDIQTGIDRFDGEPGQVPIFLWTFKNYAKELSNSGFVTGGRSSEIWVGDVTHQVPDQLFATTRNMCQQASQANTVVVESSEEMEQAESKSRSIEYDGTAEVEVSEGPVSATKTVGNSMQAGSSSEAKEYEAAARRGYTRSSFCTIEAEAYDVSGRSPPPAFCPARFVIAHSLLACAVLVLP